MCLCVCLGVHHQNHQNHATLVSQYVFSKTLNGETAHGYVGGLTACHIEVGTANFSWRFSQKRIRLVLSHFILVCTTNI